MVFFEVFHPHLSLSFEQPHPGPSGVADVGDLVRYRRGYPRGYLGLGRVNMAENSLIRSWPLRT